MNVLHSYFYWVCYHDMNFTHRSTTEAYDTDLMAEEFKSQFAGQVFHTGMPLAFSFQDKKLLSLTVKELEGKYIHA